MKGRYIIFADDDPDDLELLTGFFKQFNRNVHVLEFKNGKEVIRFLEDFAINSKPLLIVLDINMPKLNGKETLSALRSHGRFKNIPVVVYTTSSNLADEEYCRKFGASLLQKPQSIEAVKKVAKILSDFCENL